MVLFSERTRQSRKGFTLIELLVVIAIIAVLAALLFPVFSSAKRAAKKTTCLSNMDQIGKAAALYLSDSDGVYPQTRQSSTDPASEDQSGAIDEPIYKPALQPLIAYTGMKSTSQGPNGIPLFSCPEDPDPFGKQCYEIDPDAPDVNSYLVNGFFVFGLNEDSVTNPSNTIFLSERRGANQSDPEPFCDDIYHPWFTDSNADAPSNEMDAKQGAVATDRHSGVANYEFGDSHVKTLPWGATYALPAKNLHAIKQ